VIDSSVGKIFISSKLNFENKSVTSIVKIPPGFSQICHLIS
jgi:hypothetical protein